MCVGSVSEWMVQSIKSKTRLLSYCDEEVKQYVVNYVVFNLAMPNYIRQRAIMNKQGRSLGKLTCRITHNTKAVRRLYRMNRIALRQAIALNRVQGVFKAGW